MALTKPAGSLIWRVSSSIATTSGTAHTFTSIPAGTRRIVVTLVGVSHNGAGGDTISMRIGTGGSVDTTADYATNAAVGTTAPSIAVDGGVTNNARWVLTPAGAGAAATLYGSVTLTLHDPANNAWSMTSTLGRGDATTVTPYWAAGTKTLSGPLDCLNIHTASGNSFDAGAVHLAYY